MLWFAWRGNKRSRDRNFVTVSQLCHFLGSFGRYCRIGWRPLVSHTRFAIARSGITERPLTPSGPTTLPIAAVQE
jgi:hypothetical protein